MMIRSGNAGGGIRCRRCLLYQHVEVTASFGGVAVDAHVHSDVRVGADTSAHPVCAVEEAFLPIGRHVGEREAGVIGRVGPVDLDAAAALAVLHVRRVKLGVLSSLNQVVTDRIGQVGAALVALVLTAVEARRRAAQRAIVRRLGDHLRVQRRHAPGRASAGQIRHLLGTQP